MSDTDAVKALQDEIVKHIKDSGVDLVGFGPFDVLDDVKKVGDGAFDFPNAICMGTELPLETVREARNGPSADLRESYKVVNKRMMGAAAGVVEKLKAAGYNGRIIHPAERPDPENLMGPVSLKSIARVCGLGWIGKNGLVITDEFGARQRFLAILTDMPLTETPQLRECECGECRECIEHCAMKVLKDQDQFTDHPPSRDSTIDWQRCGRYENKLIGDGSKPERACGKCMAFCPKSYD